MSTPAKTEKPNRMGSYFKGVKAELKKVIWPTRKEMVKYTGMVILISAIVSITVWFIDYIIRGILSFIV